MRQFQKGLLSACLVLVVAFSIFESEQAKASAIYHLHGEVYEISRKWINVGDQTLPIMSTVKVQIKGKKNPRLLDIKKGNFVQLEMIEYNGKLYVNKIFLIERTRRRK